jgi:hypothetical protein
VAKARHGGVVYTVAPSYVDINRIWAGSDDGLVHTTADGGAHWTDVTPPELRSKPWSKISIMDAGRFDARTAYAAVNTLDWMTSSHTSIAPTTAESRGRTS